MGTLALIGLGSNLGDRKAHLDFAVAALSNTEGVTVRAVSSYHETPPIGGPSGQGSFLNAAAAIETTLNPIQVLLILQSIETQAQRIRRVRWGERTLDLDLLLFGDLVLDLPNLKIPHPLMALRRFVLAPLVEIAAEAIDPRTGRCVQALLTNVDRRPSYVAIAWGTELGLTPEGPSDDLFDRLVHRLDAKSTDGRAQKYSSGLYAPKRPSDHPFPTSAEWMAFYADVLDPSYWNSAIPSDQWIVSRNWFGDFEPGGDELPLGIVTRPHDRERFLKLRENVLRPTFVVMRTEIRERLNQPDEYCGRDTPALIVNDLDSDATLDAILAACAATRAG